MNKRNLLKKKKLEKCPILKTPKSQFFILQTLNVRAQGINKQIINTLMRQVE